jgi:hypothetical protein
LWVIIGIIALIIVAILAALWVRMAHRRRVDVRGLIAILRRNGEQAGIELKAPGKWSDTFRFIIRDEEEPAARLDYPQSGFGVYTVRRAGNGQVTLITSAGERYDDVVVGGPGEHLGHNGLELAFRDTRRRPGTQRTSTGRSGSTGRTGRDGAGRRGSTPPDDEQTTSTPPPAPAEPDPWLN